MAIARVEGGKRGDSMGAKSTERINEGQAVKIVDVKLSGRSGNFCPKLKTDFLLSS